MGNWYGFNEERSYHWVIQGQDVVGHGCQFHAVEEARGTRFYEWMKLTRQFCDSHLCKDDFLSAIEPARYRRREFNEARAVQIDKEIEWKEQAPERERAKDLKGDPYNT